MSFQASCQRGEKGGSSARLFVCVVMAAVYLIGPCQVILGVFLIGAVLFLFSHWLKLSIKFFRLETHAASNIHKIICQKSFTTPKYIICQMPKTQPVFLATLTHNPLHSRSVESTEPLREQMFCAMGCDGCMSTCSCPYKEHTAGRTRETESFEMSQVCAESIAGDRFVSDTIPTRSDVMNTLATMISRDRGACSCSPRRA